MLFPYTIPKGCPSDIACEVTEQGPVKLHRIYIENGVAKVATSYSTGRFPAWMVSRHLKWTEQFTIGNAEAVAIEFDGRWHRVGGRWELITTGEPYYFWVDGGKLSVQQGQGQAYELASSGVTKLAALRGWKNTALWNHDQGLICAYIRGAATFTTGTSPTKARTPILFPRSGTRSGRLTNSPRLRTWLYSERTTTGRAFWPNGAAKFTGRSRRGTGLSWRWSHTRSPLALT